MEKACMDMDSNLWPSGLSTIKLADAETLPEVVFYFFCRVTTPAGEQEGGGDQREAERVQTHFRGQRRRQFICITCRRRRSLRGRRAPGAEAPSLASCCNTSRLWITCRNEQGASTATRRTIALKTRTAAASESGLKKGARSLCVDKMGIHISQGANFASARAGYRINDDGRTDRFDIWGRSDRMRARKHGEGRRR